MRGDIHNYKRKLKKSVERLQNSKISLKNKKTIMEFHDQCFLEGLSIARVERYVDLLRILGRILRKDFKKADKKDIMRVMQEIGSRDYSEWTKQFYRVTLKKFYKWLRDSKEAPEEVEWMPGSVKNGKNKLPEELLSVEDIKKMIEAANHPRDKALIAILYDSGCRIGELAPLQLKHVNFDKYGAILTVDGKTGMRRVRIINSVPYLSSWVSSHPLKEDPNAPIWTNLNYRDKHEMITYRGVSCIIKRAGVKAGIKKRIFPHLFRHSRATHLANSLTEAQMKQYFGWVQSSDMAATYVHLSGRDVDNALLKLNGIKVDEEEENKGNGTLKPIKCPRCYNENPATSKFCQRCGLGLDLKTVMEKEEERSNADDLMNELIKDPEILELLQKKIKTMGVKNGN